MKKVTLKQFINNIDSFLHPTKELSNYAIYTQTEVNYGIEDDCNIKYCEEHNIPCYNIYRGAGCCVNAMGNINIADVRKQDGIWYDSVLLESFLDFLMNKEIDAILLHNDIMVDGYKVASAAGINLEPDYKWQYTCMQISINQDIETIKNVCLKPMTKEPKGLSDYGITTDDVVGWLKTLT